MATNPPKGDGPRHRSIRERSQAYNPKTERWVKRDFGTRRFIDQKANQTPLKGVRRDK